MSNKDEKFKFFYRIMCTESVKKATDFSIRSEFIALPMPPPPSKTGTSCDALHIKDPPRRGKFFLAVCFQTSYASGLSSLQKISPSEKYLINIQSFVYRFL